MYINIYIYVYIHMWLLRNISWLMFSFLLFSFSDQILSSQEEWFKAEMNGQEGFVPQNYLDTQPPRWDTVCGFVTLFWIMLDSYSAFINYTPLEAEFIVILPFFQINFQPELTVCCHLTYCLFLLQMLLSFYICCVLMCCLLIRLHQELEPNGI